MKRIYLLGVLVAVSFTVLPVNAQRLPERPRDPTNPIPEFVYKNAEKRKELERNIEKGESDIEPTEFDLGKGREARRKQNISSEERKRIEGLIAPDPEDAEKFRSFLKSAKTGLTRLIPDFGCKTSSIIYVEGNCAAHVPDGWLFSFRLQDYAEGNAWSDLRLDGSDLIADGFLTQGILVSLGDIDLVELTQNSDGIRLLTDFEPAVSLTEAKIQRANIATGIEAEGFHYSNRVAFSLDSTYALRSVAYKSEKKTKSSIVDNKMVWNGDPHYTGLSSDKRADITIVFRIVRTEENGGITILWKEILRQNSPQLVIAKTEKLTDIR